MGGLAEQFDEKALELVFGAGEAGLSVINRARVSTQMFVRSQVQLAPAKQNASGRLLTASEALDIFGFSALVQCVREGSFPILSSADEPSKTIRSRREAMNLDKTRLAKIAGITANKLESIETPGHISPIRELERLAQALALDERVLGYQPEARGDKALGVRLREMSDAADVNHFSASAVLGLAEAAWVIERQISLSKLLNKDVSVASKFGFSPDNNYAYPTWKQGYRLAELTRQKLGIAPEAPIESLRSLVEDTLQIPLVQQQLDARFAGATISNESHRGIVVNEKGRNESVWIRRMTLCHELGHLLWDPDQRLNRLVVDEYDAINLNYSSVRDLVELRANAFAIAFLAPPSAVKALARTSSNPSSIVTALMVDYGISGTAAKWHASNVAGVDSLAVRVRNLPAPSDEWIARENMTIDYFPISATPISRRGKFASLVFEALQNNAISEDTCAMYLKCSAQDVRLQADNVRSIFTAEPVASQQN
jgi:Zn-dependent peptidase ImmA (M78 family)